ncbi:MAG: hypothetical protein D6725_17470 [Planctomycetota bacterium]|nr:MAG: hypothetical protein D6725_17470 [Planctomycetota bacterium]
MGRVSVVMAASFGGHHGGAGRFARPALPGDAGGRQAVADRQEAVVEHGWPGDSGAAGRGPT